VLDKRGACYRGRPGSSTPKRKKFQLDKGVTGAAPPCLCRIASTCENAAPF